MEIKQLNENAGNDGKYKYGREEETTDRTQVVKDSNRKKNSKRKNNKSVGSVKGRND